MPESVHAATPARVRPDRRRSRRILSQKTAPFVFILPALAVFTVWVVYPLLASFQLSFYDYAGYGERTFIGLDNYRELFQDDRFWQAIANNVRWFVLFLLAPPIGLALALFLNQTMFGIRIIKSLFFMPFVISQAVVALLFSWFYLPGTGLLDATAGFFGIPPLAVLSDERTVTYAIIVAGLWPQIAFCMILYLTGLNAINPELIEAARLDRARGWRMFRHIVLPQLAPATFMAVVVTMIGSLRSFDLVAMMTAGGPYGSSNVLAYLMYDQAIGNFRNGYGAAIAVVLFLIMSAFIAAFLWHMLRQERRG